MLYVIYQIIAFHGKVSGPAGKLLGLLLVAFGGGLACFLHMAVARSLYRGALRGCGGKVISREELRCKNIKWHWVWWSKIGDFAFRGTLRFGSDDCSFYIWTIRCYSRYCSCYQIRKDMVRIDVNSGFIRIRGKMGVLIECSPGLADAIKNELTD